MEEEKHQFMEYLSGNAPLARGFKDRRGWGSSRLYTSTHGYSMYSAVPSVANDPAIWKNLWEAPTLPKIDIFCWTVLHNRIFTRENLQKRGIEGAFRFPLCRVNYETMLYLFFICPFARAVWGQLTILWFGKVEFPGNIHL